MATMTASDAQACELLSRTYLASPASVGQARRTAERALAACGTPKETAEDAGLIVSELMTNAGRASPYEEVRLTLGTIGPRTVFVEVWDPSPRLPERRTPADEDPGGRGLGIVAGLATHWGVRRERRGKSVYALLSVWAR